MAVHKPMTPNTTGCTSIHKAIQILREFSLDNPELGVSELSRRLGMAKSTVGRLMQILEEVHLIQKNPKTRKYRLSLDTLEIGSVVYHEMEVVRVAPPLLRRLMQAVRSEIQMNVYDKGGIVCLIKLPDDRDTRILTSMGMRVPCHCNAAGKVLLAYQKEEEISRVLQGELKRYTPKTITSAEKLRAEIEKIRKMGYAVSDEEYREELFTIAVPVFDSGNHVVAAVSVTRPKQLVTSSEVEFIVRELKTCSRLISEKLEIQAARRRQKTEK